MYKYRRSLVGSLDYNGKSARRQYEKQTGSLCSAHAATWIMSADCMTRVAGLRACGLDKQRGEHVQSRVHTERTGKSISWSRSVARRPPGGSGGIH